MNASLAALLRDLARQLDGAAGDPGEWHDAIVLQNYGVLPAGRAGRLPSLRGFNLLLLDRTGRPRHFAKCRPLANEDLARETAVLRQLASTRAGSRHVPAVAMGVGSAFSAQLARFQPGEPLQPYLRHASPERAEAAVLEILDVASLLGGLVSESTPAIPAGLDLRREAGPHLAAVARAGLDPESAGRISAVLADTGPVRPAPQHGDLWAPNVLRAPDAWVLLDFEFFGQLCVPMVDALQLVRTSGDVLWPIGASATWIGELERDSPRSRFTRRLLDASRDRLGLDDAAALGCVAFALLEITGRFLLAGRSAVDWEPSLLALRDFAALLDTGPEVPAALFGRAAA